MSSSGTSALYYTENRSIAVSASTNTVVVDLSSYNPQMITAMYIRPDMTGVGPAHFITFRKTDGTYSQNLYGRSDVFSTFTWTLVNGTLTIKFNQSGSVGQWYPITCYMEIAMI